MVMNETKEQKIEKTEIILEDRETKKTHTVTVESETNFANSPDKISALMRLLDLPEGSKAVLKTTIGSLWIR
jgi:hypothetical protein